MKLHELALSIGEPFTSPAWGSNFVMFSGEAGVVIAEEDSKEYLRKVCRYAKHYEVYLIPERFLLMGYQCMCLISPLGKVLGAQRAIHLNLSAREAAKRGASIEVFSTEFGGIALCVDVDVYRPEIARIACEMGAQYLFCAQQMKRGDYSSHMIITGIWSAAQSNRMYTVSVSNQFHCVCAPRMLTPHGDGFLAKPGLKTPMTAKLNADLLADCDPHRPLSRKLYAVHRGDLIG